MCVDVSGRSLSHTQPVRQVDDPALCCTTWQLAGTSTPRGDAWVPECEHFSTHLQEAGVEVNNQSLRSPTR